MTMELTHHVVQALRTKAVNQPVALCIQRQFNHQWGSGSWVWRKGWGRRRGEGGEKEGRRGERSMEGEAA